MQYKLELQKILSTIKRAGGSTRCIIKTPSEEDSITGEKDEPLIMEPYFAQVNYNNEELGRDPSLIEGIKIIVCPLRDDGAIETDFLYMCRHKGTSVILPDGKNMSVKFARITTPNNITPIVARLDLGG